MFWVVLVLLVFFIFVLFVELIWIVVISGVYDVMFGRFCCC